MLTIKTTCIQHYCHAISLFGHPTEPLIDLKVWMETKAVVIMTDLTDLLIDDKGGLAGLGTKRQIG